MPIAFRRQRFGHYPNPQPLQVIEGDCPLGDTFQNVFPQGRLMNRIFGNRASSEDATYQIFANLALFGRISLRHKLVVRRR